MELALISLFSATLGYSAYSLLWPKIKSLYLQVRGVAFLSVFAKRLVSSVSLAIVLPALGIPSPLALYLFHLIPNPYADNLLLLQRLVSGPNPTLAEFVKGLPSHWKPVWDEMNRTANLEEKARIASKFMKSAPLTSFALFILSVSPSIEHYRLLSLLLKIMASVENSLKGSILMAQYAVMIFPAIFSVLILALKGSGMGMSTGLYFALCYVAFAFNLAGYIVLTLLGVL